MHAARHEVVARALGRRVRQYGGLDLDELAVRQERADERDDAVPQDDVVMQPLAPQVQVAVLEAELLIDVGILIDVERRRLGGVEQLGRLGAHLDLASDQVGVLGAGAAALNAAVHPQHILATRIARDGVGRGLLRVEDGLHEAAAVAQVDKDQSAVIAATMHPAGEDDIPAFVAGAQVAAVVSLVHVSSQVGAGGAIRRVRRSVAGGAETDSKRQTANSKRQGGARSRRRGAFDGPSPKR